MTRPADTIARPDEVLALRTALKDSGWEPIAVCGKAPVVKGWQAGEITPERIRAERERHPDAVSTGIRTGHVVGIDIDVEDPAEATHIKDVVERCLGASPFVRVGRKGMLVCYWNPAPLSKITVASSDRTKVELLGSGQQAVAYGDHPDTGKPYIWTSPGDEPAKAEVWQLPQVTPEGLRTLASELATALAERHPDVRITGDVQKASTPATAARARRATRANDHAPPATGAPLSPKELTDRLYCCDPDMHRDDWRDLGASLRAMPCTDPAFVKRELFVAWSRDGLATFTSDEACETVYDTMPPMKGGIGPGTFITMTNEAGYRRPPEEVYADLLANLPHEWLASDDRDAGLATPYPPPKAAAELVAGDFPRAEYLWEKFILRGYVNLLYGDGGTGKTLLAEHIAVAVAAGVDLFGFRVQCQPVLLVLAEDDDGETKARLEAICAMLAVNLADLPIKTWCLPGWDAALAHVADDGSAVPGAFMEPLRAELARMGGPCLLVLDTVSDIATLDENKRLPVNTLCKIVLTGLCRDFKTTVFVNAHPSKGAMVDGSHYAGSTAWNNAVRNRLTLERPRPGSEQRVLTVAKANYGEGGTLELYQVGLTLVTAPEAGHSEAEERAAVLAMVLELLDKGVAIVRANGAGQKPSDLARAIFDRHRMDLEPRRVLEHLNTLERLGKLQYQSGGNASRGQKAGFRRPVASSVASPSQAVSQGVAGPS